MLLIAIEVKFLNPFGIKVILLKFDSSKITSLPLIKTTNTSRHIQKKLIIRKCKNLKLITWMGVFEFKLNSLFNYENLHLMKQVRKNSKKKNFNFVKIFCVESSN